MKYSLGFHPATRKDLRRIAVNARDKILFAILPELSANPFKGIPLSGPLRGFYKYRVFLFVVWYRIVYKIYTKQRECHWSSRRILPASSAAHEKIIYYRET